MDTEHECKTVYQEADAAGRAAAAALVPAPMIVTGPVGIDDQPLPTTRTYYVADGVCGFAWVNIRPATARFARWLKAQGLARRDTNAGGVMVWVSDYDQSMQRKAAYAEAFAAVLVAHGIKAFADSQID